MLLLLVFILALLRHLQPLLSIYSDNTFQTTIGIFFLSASAISNMKIVILLILECACLLHASSSRPSCSEALDMAYSQYETSGIHNAIGEQFPSFQRCSISQITEFILGNRLS
jgi:hypothetical protein